MVKITGIGWRLKFYFFLILLCQSIQCFNIPLPPPWWGREFEPELLSPSNGIKCLFFFLTRNMGIWTNQSSEVQTPSGVTQGGGYDVEALYWLTNSVERHSEKAFLEQQRKLCTSLCEATKALNPITCPTRDICILYPSQKRMHLWEQTCFRSQSWAKASSLYLGKKGTEPVRKQQMLSKIVFLQK